MIELLDYPIVEGASEWSLYTQEYPVQDPYRMIFYVSSFATMAKAYLSITFLYSLFIVAVLGTYIRP